MGFFKDIGKSIEKTAKAVVKDALPIAAGVMTGGASLQYLQPTALLVRVDKATGLPVSSIAGSMNPLNKGGAATVTEPEPAATQQSIAPPFAPASNQSIYDQITPYLNSFMQANTKSAADTPTNATAIVAPAPSSNKMIFIIGGAILAVGSFFLLLRKK